MPIYMKITDSSGTQVVRGTGKGAHAGWIELRSASVMTHRKVKAPTERGGSSGPDYVSQVAVTKDNDEASSDLFRLSLDGKPLTITIDFVNSASPDEAPYLSLLLTKAVIAAYQVSGGDGTVRPLESLSLDAEKIEYTAKPTSASVQGVPDRASWDLAAARGM
jgi:type VI protein secretion system component Hcp